MRKRTFIGLAIALVALTGPANSQTVVETFTSWNGNTVVTPFGHSGATDAYGQVFTAPAQYLNSWSFWLANNGGGDGVQFTANVGTWTGTQVGSVLWTSGLNLGTSSLARVQYTWNTGGVSLLTGGESYVFYLDAVGGSGSLGFGIIGSDVYAGGYFEFNNDTDHFQDWNGGFPQYDLAFSAEFDRVPGGPGSTVPEPATMTLLATGLAGMVAARKRKRES